MSQQINNPTATAYARALLEMADERGQLQPVANDVDGLRQVIADDETVAAFLRGRGISTEDRAGLLDRTFGDGKVNPVLFNVLQVMNNKGRLPLLPQMLDAFERLMDEKLGKVEVDVTTAAPLDGGQLEDVRSRVSRALGKDAVVHQYIDESILGGMILRVGDQVIDSSVKSQLEQMRQRLLRA